MVVSTVVIKKGCSNNTTLFYISLSIITIDMTRASARVNGLVYNTSFQNKAILKPKIVIVDEINNYIGLIPGKEKTYLSCDSPCSNNSMVDGPDDVHTPILFNTMNPALYPNDFAPSQSKCPKGIVLLLIFIVTH